MNRPLLAAGALFLACLGTAGAVYLASTGGEEEVAPNAQEIPSPTVPLESPLPSILPTIPAGLPIPADGYMWFVTPTDWATPVDFAVQVPLGWVRTVDANFVPAGTLPNFPYPEVPQLMVFVGRVDPNPPDTHPGWQHPFVWQVGQQGGGGCEGDVSNRSLAAPSSIYPGEAYTWDIYSFACHVENLTFPPGVSYDGRAAETRAGELVFTVMAFEPVGTGLTAPAFEQALQSFRLP